MPKLLKFFSVTFPYIVVVFVFLYFIFSRIPFEYIKLVITSLVLTFFAVFLLKVFFKEPRPNNHRTQAFFDYESKFSFPSEHAAFFSALGVSFMFWDLFLGILLILSALLIGSARAISQIHYWRDIFAGWLLGTLVTFIIFYI